MKRTLIITIIACLALLACGKRDKDRPANIEELHREQGIPVTILEIAHTDFAKEIEYNVTVVGLRETPVYSFVSDVVQRIRTNVGQRVSQNQVIIDFPENNIQANYHQAEAAYNLAQQVWERMQNLYESGGISKQDLDGAETQFKVAQANWDAVQQTVHVRAPISGTITDINVRQNQKINPGDYLFTVSQLNRLHGRVWITENVINDIPRNAEVLFRWNDIEKKGRIANLALSLNRDHNAFAADIEIDNSDFAVRSGVTGKATILLYRNPEAIVIPRNVVLREPETYRNYVYIAERDTAVKRYITIKNESDINFEIESGLNVGDMLITGGYQFVSDQIKINITD
jgi:RND family efflux transporter MFP subunit